MKAWGFGECPGWHSPLLDNLGQGASPCSAWISTELLHSGIIFPLLHTCDVAVFVGIGE